MKRVTAWILVLVLCLGMFAGCKKKNKDSNNDVSSGVNIVDTADLEAALEYIKTVYRKVSETTPADYKRIAVVPVNGKNFDVEWTVDVGEEFVKVVKGTDGMVTIDVNEEAKEDVPYNLTATITAGDESVSHKWKHVLPAGMSLEDMIEIVKAAYALAPGESLGYDVTLRGKVTMINTPWSDDYQNITVTMVVEGAEDMPIQCYRLKGDGAKDLKIGDIITVTGELKNYNGTIEFVAGCTLDAVVKGEEVKAPDDMKQIVDEAYALGANESLPYEATLKGVVTEIGTPYNAQYGNVTVTMVVEGRENKPIVCYRMKGNGVDQIGINDIITVRGYITNYVGSKGISTIEFTAGCQLIEWEDKWSPTQPSDPKEVVDQAYALGANQTLPYEATLTGRITKINTAYDASYGNITVTMVIEGRENKPIVCYRMKGSGVDKIGMNDIITVKGYITNYVGDKGYSTIEFNYPELVSYTKNTITAPTDSAEIVRAAYALAPGAQLPYEATVTGRITKVNTAYDANYGNITVTIEVTGAENMPLKCYRLKGSGVDVIGIGDTITVKGFIENYVHSSGDTEVEFTAGCQLVSYQKNTNVAPSDSLEIVKAAYALAPGAQLPYEATVTGVITKVNTPYDSGYGNVTVTIVVPGGEDMPIKCYRLKGSGVDQIYEGCTITVKGYIENYVHSSGDSEIEFTQGCQLISWEHGGSEPTTPPVGDEIAKAALMTELPEDGDLVVIYNSGMAMTKEPSGSRMGSEPATVADYILSVTETMAQVEVTVDGDYYIFTVDGKYLTSAVAGNGMSLEDTLTDCGKWTMESAETGKWYINNVGANYNGNYNQAMEYYSGFTTYGKKETDIYKMELYKIGGSAPDIEPSEPTVPSEPSEPTTPPVTTTVVEMVTAPEAETAYKLYMNKTSDGKILFFNGQTESETVTYRLATTEYAEEAVDVYLEETTGGYFLYYMNEGVKTYIRIYERDAAAGKGSLELSFNVPAEVLTYNSDYNTLVLSSAASGNAYYAGTYSTYVTFSVSNLSYMSADNLDVSQFPAHLGTLTEGEPVVPPTEPTEPSEPTEPTEPDVTEPTTPVTPDEPEFVTEPQAGVAYKFGMIQENVGEEIYYIDGAKNNYYMNTVVDVADAADVYLEQTAGGFYLYTFVDGAKTYINMVVNGTHVNGEYQDTAATVYTYDASLETVVATVNDTLYMFGTRNDRTYTTVGPVKVELEGFRCKFYTVEAAPEVPTEPTTTEPVATEPEVTEPSAPALPDEDGAEISIADALAAGSAMEHNTYTTLKYKVTGVVARVYNTQYGNMYIRDEAGNELNIYGTFSADGETRYDALEVKPVAGDTVTVYGVIGQFNGRPQMLNGWIVAHSTGEAPPAPPAVELPGEDGAAITIAQAVAAANTMEHNVYTNVNYKVTGEIAEVYNTQYGNMRIKDADGNILTLYGTYNEDGTISYKDMAVQPVAGDTITIYGKLGQFNGNPQIKDGWIVEHIPAAPEATEPEATEPTTTPTTPSEPSEDAAALLTELPQVGDEIVIYNSGMAMTATDNGGKLTGEAATVTDYILPLTATMAKLTVEKDGEYYVFTLDGKYLTSAPTGNGLSFADELTDCGKWIITEFSTGTWIIKNVGANYNGNYNQAMETYNGNFTTYGEKATEIYQMQMFKVGGAAPEVTPPTEPEVTEPSVPETTEPEATEPAAPTGSYTQISSVAQLSAGTYLVAVYAETGNKGAVDFSANPWHFWDGNITTGTNLDLITNTYAYVDGGLAKFVDSTNNASKNGDAVKIELVAVDGAVNTYYIKLGDLYLSSNGYAKRKLQLTSTPAEWVAEDNANGGIVFHQYFGTDFVSIGFADAATNMIRCYKSSSGNMNSGIKAGLYFFKEN